MVERRVASVLRGLLVTLFLLESVGILLVSLVISVLMDGSLLDSPDRSRVRCRLPGLDISGGGGIPIATEIRDCR